jgi:hypothetical protein
VEGGQDEKIARMEKIMAELRERNEVLEERLKAYGVPS